VGTKRTLVLALLLAVGAVLVSGTASALDRTARTSRPLGVLAPRGGAEVPAAAGNMSWHGGPVMHSTNVYSIYWAPTGYGYQSGYDTAIDKYFRDVAADSGKLTNVYGAMSQYSDGAGPALYASSFSTSLTDTNSYPASGCDDSPYTSVCVTDGQLQAELQSFVAANGLPTGMSTAYFVFLPVSVGTCFDSTSSECSYTQFCAYHGWIGSGGPGTILYANMPYADQPSAGGKCDIESSPNGTDADATINVTSHEHNEMITDPLGNAWYDSGGYEVADKCAWVFGSNLGSTQFGAYNQAIATGKYELQEEWSNVLTACVQNAVVLPPTITSFSPAKGRAGALITLTGKNLLGASKVQLRNVTATFSVVSATRITARVPSGVTGLAKWTVTTPGGTATSPYFCTC
jgi:IPT/TIG domain